MARKATLYTVATDTGSMVRSYVPSEGPSLAHYSWATQRRDARKFTREAAETAARDIEAAIAAYYAAHTDPEKRDHFARHPVRLVIAPATGGAPIVR